MNAATKIRVHRRDHRLRRVGWTAVWLVVIVTTGEFLLTTYGKYARLDSAAYAMFVERHGWLWLHLIGGLQGLVLGPLQFLTGWYRTRPLLHRFIGYAYFSGMLVAIGGAVGLIASSPAPMAIRVAFASTALAWTVTGLIALNAIRWRQVTTHRHWMIRNYLVTIAPVLFRVMLYSYVSGGHAATPEAIALMLWMSWFVPQVLYIVVCLTARVTRIERQTG